MGTRAVEPRAIRNVTLFGDLDGTNGVGHRLRHSGSPMRWATGQVEHLIRFTEVCDGDPERSIRVADGAIAVIDASVRSSPRVEAMLRAADDYQVARLCVIDGLDRPGADLDGCIRRISDIRGAIPLLLQVPLGTGPALEGVVDLIPMWQILPRAAEVYGEQWEVAARWHRRLLDTVTEPDTGPPTIDELHIRIRALTRIGEIVPVLCGAVPGRDDLARLRDAIVRYLPSPMDVCQPEHALDY
ncbi:GTP-binding protein [Nocardia sp. NPDC050712]|uniref:GTP-binding protein n=1 Tax=Nocardia sp. NPDC050712 TaxID=3155518 RepID=UPI0033C247FA